MQTGRDYQHSVRAGIVTAAAILLSCFVERSLQRADAQYTGLCTPWESVSCEFGVSGAPNYYVRPSERPCDRGCYNGGMSLGYRWEAFDLHVDPRVAWIPPDLPPATNDPRLGTPPLVPADAAHLAGPTPFAERPVHNGLMDAVLGTRMLQVTDFELPFGGAVFRHVRTNSDIWDQSWRCDDTGSSMVELLTPERAFWDWNGRRWMMGESPLFLMDASPTWNVGEPPKCYFIPDAFHAIPFVLDASACASGGGTPRYAAPPWFDATIEFMGGDLQCQSDGSALWVDFPEEVRISLNRSSIAYTIRMSTDTIPPSLHIPATDGDCWGEYIDSTGVPYWGMATRIEDRYGHKILIEYCGDTSWECGYGRLDELCEANQGAGSCSSDGLPQTCSTLCRNCNEKGQIKSIRLVKPNGTPEGEVVWTLLYTYRAFGAHYTDTHCPAIGACACCNAAEGGVCSCDGFPVPDPGCERSDWDDINLRNHVTLHRPHFLHSIHVYRDAVSTSDCCLTIGHSVFCDSVSLDDYDAINHPAITSRPDWELEARYTYDEYFFGNDTDVGRCPVTYSYDAANHWGTESKHLGGNLLKASITRRTHDGPGGDVTASVTDDTVYLAEGNRHDVAAVFDDSATKLVRSGLGTSASANAILALQPSDPVGYVDPSTGATLTKPLRDLAVLRFGIYEYGGSATTECPDLGGVAYAEGLISWYGGDPSRTNVPTLARRVEDHRSGSPKSGTFVYHSLEEYPASPPCECATATCEWSHYDGYACPFAVGARPETIKYPFRFKTAASNEPECQGEYYKRLMDGANGSHRFHIAIIDELADGSSATVGGSTAYDPAPLGGGLPKGVRTRRVIESNAAGFVLKDRTWEFKPSGATLTASAGYGEEVSYDCRGRIVERRTPGWSAGVSEELSQTPPPADPGSDSGLIYVYEYEDSCSMDEFGGACICTDRGTGQVMERVGEPTAVLIRKGTSGQDKLYLKRFVRDQFRPELIAKQIECLDPVGDTQCLNGNTTLITHVWDSSKRIQSKDVIRPQAAAGVGGAMRYSVERLRYNETGNLVWRGIGSVADWQGSPSGPNGDEFFVDHYSYDLLGRVTTQIQDFNAVPGTPDLPDGFLRAAAGDALALTTAYDYDDVFGLKHVRYPNGREEHTVYVRPAADPDRLERWHFRDGVCVNGEPGSCTTWQFLSPLELSSTTSAQLEWSKLIRLATAFPGTPEQFAEGYNVNASPGDVISETIPEYDSNGRFVGLRRKNGGLPDSDEVRQAISYNAFGQIDRQQSASGTVTRHVYDHRGRLTKTYRGTDDHHEFWRTVASRWDDQDTSNDCATSYELNTDDLVLIEKRSYGSGVTNADRLVEVRNYREKPQNQYAEALAECCLAGADPSCFQGEGTPPDQLAANDEDSNDRIWARELHEYDWRMREVVVRRTDAAGAPIQHVVTWLDHQDRVRLRAVYADQMVTDSALDPRKATPLTPPPAAAAILAATPAPMSLTETLYNARGKVEETRAYSTTPDGAGGYPYTFTRTFYNHDDKPVEVARSNGPTQRYRYDAKGRQTDSFTIAAGTELAHTQTEFDADDRAIKVIARERRHDTLAGSAPIDDSNSVRTFTHNWYDLAGRLRATVEFGTHSETYANGTEVPSYDPGVSPAQVSGEPPRVTNCVSPAPSALCTCFDYDPAGRQDAVFHPDGTVSRSEFDGLGRLLLTVENADDPDPSAQQVTARRYDDKGRLWMMAAVLPQHNQGPGSDGRWNHSDVDWNADDGSLQITELVYGGKVVEPDTGENLTHNLDWIKEVRFPAATTHSGAGGGTVHAGRPDEQDKLTFRYYSDGSIASRVDQRGIELDFQYDELNRRIETTVHDDDWFGTGGPSNRVHRVAATYEPSGALSKVTAYSHTGGAEHYVAENQFDYDGFENLLRDRQAHLGPVTIVSPTVDYAWDTQFSVHGGYGFSRIAAMQYPTAVGTTDRRTVSFTYGSSFETPASAMNWVTQVGVSGLTPPTATYEYTGSSRRVSTTFGNGLHQSVAGGDGYAGLDRFGRLIDLHYQKQLNTTVHRYQYGYDHAGNPTFCRVTQVDWTGIPSDRDNIRSHLFRYDDLNRLERSQIGQLENDNKSVRATPVPITTQWRLDSLGNWTGDGVEAGMTTEADFDLDLELDVVSVTHTVGSNNELQGIAGESTLPWIPTTTGALLHDAAGNLVCDEGEFVDQPQTTFACTGYVYQYDGFNRLVQVNGAGTATFAGVDGRQTAGALGDLIFRHTYDGLGRLIRKELPESATNTQFRLEDYYYDGVRRIQDVIRRPLAVPEPPEPCDEITPITKQSPGSKGAPETPWETEGGVVIGPEPPPCHEEDPSGSTQGPTYETWTDREYVYHAAAGAQLDEFILQIDRAGAPMYMLQDAGLNVVGLVDQSGDIIRQDTYAPYGEVVATDLFNLSFGHNQAGWKGLFFDRLVANALGSQLTPGGVGLYRARNRSYSPTLGRWLQRDPNATAQPILEAVLSNGLAFSDFALRMDVPTLYGDGMNLFQFGRSNPIANGDPMGLFSYGEIAATAGAMGFLGSIMGAVLGGPGHRLDGAVAGGLAGVTGGIAGLAFAASFTGLFATVAFAGGSGFVGNYVYSMQTGASVPEAIDNAYFGAAFNMVLLGFGSALSGYIDDVIGKMCFERGTNVVLETGQAVAIDQVHIGDYVKTIPESRNTAQDHEIVDAGDWRIIELTVETEGCDAVAITLLRPETWISAHGLRHDKHKFLMLPDAGVVGMARIEGVHLCPEPLHVSDGLVTGTFVTENATVLDLYVDSSTRPIGATATHPFYSVDQQRWVTAGRLAVGERIGTADGVATTLALIPRTDRQTVYNLEVHGSHTFFVGESQLWAHNVCDLIKVYSARVLNRAAEAADSYHNFPMTFDDAIIANGEHVLNGTYLKVTLEGTINGQTGTYELGGQMVGNIFRITHRFFNPG